MRPLGPVEVALHCDVDRGGGRTLGVGVVEGEHADLVAEALV